MPPVSFPTASSQPLAARLRMPSSLSGIGSFAPEDTRFTTMAQQVKEVLPHVPLEVIRTDLGKLKPWVLAGTQDHPLCHVTVTPESKNPRPCCTVKHNGRKEMSFPAVAAPSLNTSSVFLQPRQTVWIPLLPTCWRGECPSSLKVRLVLTCLLHLPPGLHQLLASRAPWLCLLPRYFESFSVSPALTAHRWSMMACVWD